jgi:hypothetical protein
MDIKSFATENDIVILNNFWGMYAYLIPTHKMRPMYILKTIRMDSLA